MRVKVFWAILLPGWSRSAPTTMRGRPGRQSASRVNSRAQTSSSAVRLNRVLARLVAGAPWLLSWSPSRLYQPQVGSDETYSLRAPRPRPGDAMWVASITTSTVVLRRCSRGRSIQQPQISAAVNVIERSQRFWQSSTSRSATSAA